MDATTIAASLAKLTRKAGKIHYVKCGNVLELSLTYADTWSLTATHLPTRRTRSVELAREDVYTKSREQWFQSQVWRLKPETVEKWASNLAKSLEKLEARNTEKAGNQ